MRCSTAEKIRRAAWVIASLGALAGASACRQKPGAAKGEEEVPTVHAASSVLAADPDEPEPAVTKRPPKATVATSQRIDIPAGSFVSGSTPGDRGREPGREPALVKVELGSFAIDRLPYPNDPSQPARTGVTRQQAAQLCTERGQRLCTELEWERACKGPDSNPYPTGAAWDPACETHPSECASGFDVLAMGAALREWTSSNVGTTEAEASVLAVLRGAQSKVADTEHRCAKREPARPDAESDSIGFRCCAGAPNAAVITEPKPLQTYRRVQLDPEQVTKMMHSVPELASLGEVTFFAEPDDVNRVTAKGDAGRGGNNLTTNPLLWSPDVGEEILVMTGLGSSGSSFIAAFHRLPDDRYRLASSFVLKNDKGPIVLAFNGWVKNRVTWSTCWGCLGEEGAVIYRKSRRVVIEQR